MKNVSNKSEPVPRSEFDSIMGTQSLLLTGVVIVLFVAFLNPIIDAWRFRSASYEALIQKVNDQNTDLKSLREEINDLNTALGVKKIIEIQPQKSIDIKKDFSLTEK